VIRQQVNRLMAFQIDEDSPLGNPSLRIVGEQDVSQVKENVDSELAPAGSAGIRAVLER